MPRFIGREEVARLIDEGAQVVEVLEREQYEEFHLPGAVSIPLWELEERHGELDRSRPVVLYCNDFQ